MRRDPLTEAWTIFSASHPNPLAFHSVLEEPASPSPFTAGNERFVPHALYSAVKTDAPPVVDVLAVPGFELLARYGDDLLSAVASLERHFDNALHRINSSISAKMSDASPIGVPTDDLG